MRNSVAHFKKQASNAASTFSQQKLATDIQAQVRKPGVIQTVATATAPKRTIIPVGFDSKLLDAHDGGTPGASISVVPVALSAESVNTGMSSLLHRISEIKAEISLLQVKLIKVHDEKILKKAFRCWAEDVPVACHIELLTGALDSKEGIAVARCDADNDEMSEQPTLGSAWATQAELDAFVATLPAEDSISSQSSPAASPKGSPIGSPRRGRSPTGRRRRSA